jgi:hypothetical protein
MKANCYTTEATDMDRGRRRARKSLMERPCPRFVSVSSVVVLFVSVVALLVLLASSAGAQNVETDPLQCWWRTSAGAVRVGEPFTVVLTCAVLETDAATVVVDQSKIDPSVVQFAPFEVLGGQHGADLHTDLRRFFQYEYRLRLIGENQFGKDVPLPETKLAYRVQSRVGQKTSIQGRDQSYVLPAQSVRVLSLVPADTADIRDASAETFADLDQRAFRANLLIVVGGVLFALAVLLALLAAVRLYSRLRKPSAAADRLVSDGAILRAAGRELSAVQRAREDAGWTPELAGRALTPLRVAAAYALGRPVARTLASQPLTSDNGAGGAEGALLVRKGWPRRKVITVSGAATARSVAQEHRRGLGNPRRAALLESLDRALVQCTAAQYGRGDALDTAALDEALTAGRAAVRRVALEQTWVMRKFGPRRPAREVEARAWSR